MNIAELLVEAAARAPERPAIVQALRGRERVVSFGELDQRSRRVATLFQREGLTPGAGILGLLPMGIDLYVVMAAALRAGLVAVFVDPAAGREHLKTCLGLFPVKALVVSWKAWLLRMLWPELRSVGTLFVAGRVVPGATGLAQARDLPPLDRIEPCAPDTPAVLTFTSGSTGRPKGALRTHGLLLATHRALVAHLPPVADGMDLATLPMLVFTNLAAGVTSLIPPVDLRYPGSIDGASVATEIQRRRPTTTLASPAFLERIADASLERGVSLDSLLRIATGGAPVFPRVIDKLARVAPRAEILSIYGSTEAEPMAVLPHREIGDQERAAMLRGEGLLAGRPIKELELRIVADRRGTRAGPSTAAELETETLPPGSAGEIIVSGAHVLPGYLGGVGDDENYFHVDGRRWHRTGDGGCLDQAGRLWLVGRCAARVADARGILYPFSVEAALAMRESFARTAFLAHEGRRLLVVESRRRVDAAARQALARHVPWALVDDVIVVERIPVDRRHNAKVDYPALTALLRRRLAADGAKAR